VGQELLFPRFVLLEAARQGLEGQMGAGVVAGLELRLDRGELVAEHLVLSREERELASEVRPEAVESREGHVLLEAHVRFEGGRVEREVGDRRSRSVLVERVLDVVGEVVQAGVLALDAPLVGSHPDAFARLSQLRFRRHRRSSSDVSRIVSA
jgi:hypothetical protein